MNNPSSFSHPSYDKVKKNAKIHWVLLFLYVLFMDLL